jgi:hypothetical protein
VSLHSMIGQSVVRNSLLAPIRQFVGDFTAAIVLLPVSRNPHFGQMAPRASAQMGTDVPEPQPSTTVGRPSMDRRC